MKDFMDFIKNNKKIVLLSLVGLVLTIILIFVIMFFVQNNTRNNVTNNIDSVTLNKKAEKYQKVKELQDKISELSNSKDTNKQQELIRYREQLMELEKSE